MAQISDGDNTNNNILKNDVAEETITTTTTTKRHRSSHGGDSLHAPLPILPFELINEILSRVPVKFLIQFKRVCKSWKTLISDPQFAKKHLSTIHHQHLLLSIDDPLYDFLLGSYSLHSIFQSSPPISTQVSYPLNIDNSFVLMVGSCDGMLCFVVDKSCALLWNPSIREFKKLPPLEKHIIYGFGYDHSSDSYKVVAVLRRGCYSVDASAYVTELKVHTLGTDSWRRIQECPSGMPADSSSKFVSGTLNWLASVAPTSYSYVIVSLDLGKESCEELLQPDYGDVTVLTLHLGVLKNCLSIVAHNEKGSSDVWLMNDYGNKESWTKLFCIPCLESPRCLPYGRVICVSEDEEVLFEFFSMLAVYNSRNGTFKFPEIPATDGWPAPQIYVESLISPCS